MAQLQAINTIRECSWQNPKRIGFKTNCWRLGSSFAMRLHGTQVIAYDDASKTLWLHTGNWRTKITLDRMRHGLAYLGLQLSTSDIKGQWRVLTPCGQAFTIFGDRLELKLIDGEWSRVGVNIKRFQLGI